MTTRRKFLSMLGLAPVAAAASASLIKSVAANPKDAAIIGIKQGNLVNGLPFNVKDGQTYIDEALLTPSGRTYLDKDGLRVENAEGVTVFRIGKL